MNLADYCGRCFHWVWGKGCKCGRFVNGKNVETSNTDTKGES